MAALSVHPAGTPAGANTTLLCILYCEFDPHKGPRPVFQVGGAALRASRARALVACALCTRVRVCTRRRFTLAPHARPCCLVLPRACAPAGASKLRVGRGVRNTVRPSHRVQRAVWASHQRRRLRLPVCGAPRIHPPRALRAQPVHVQCLLCL